MKNQWDDREAVEFQDPLSLRAYTSRLIGRDEDLVLHGGGNTSLKSTVTDLFGDDIEVLYVKGSGWDLAAIEPRGFAPVRLDVLRRMATLETLSDGAMVRSQRAAMLDPSAPNPSVEAILHAIIPFRFVDHTHADAVVALSNTPGGEQAIRDLYGDRVLVVPYVMPGFELARHVARITESVDWQALDGMVLMNHGVFSFGDEARRSYDAMIRLVTEAEDYLDSQGARQVASSDAVRKVDCEKLTRLRDLVSIAAGKPVLVGIDNSPEAVGFSEKIEIEDIARRGPLTPDHVIRTKRLPLIVRDDVDRSVAGYINEYKHYFLDNTDGSLVCLDPAPRWGIWPGRGILSFAPSAEEQNVIADIARHTLRAIQWGEALGGWQPLPEKDIFNVEYWELEQAKVNSTSRDPVFQGRVALVTGAASGIGRACVDALRERGAAVIALDMQDMKELDSSGIAAVRCDVTDAERLKNALDEGVRSFGGVDIVVSNAGDFPGNRTIEEMDDDTWNRSLSTNLSSHQRLLRFCIPYLRNGTEPSVVIVGSKNVPAPGPGASAYSVAKAGLTQLARVAALELGEAGIRVNTVHPNAVFDTGIWTQELIEKRASRYGKSTEEYMTANLLKTRVTAADVAAAVCELAGPAFSRTTGAQVPVDGGNERVV